MSVRCKLPLFLKVLSSSALPFISIGGLAWTLLGSRKNSKPRVREMVDSKRAGDSPVSAARFVCLCVENLTTGEQKNSSKCFPFRTVFQIEINFQLRDVPPLTLLFIGGRLLLLFTFPWCL